MTRTNMSIKVERKLRDMRMKYPIRHEKEYVCHVL